MQTVNRSMVNIVGALERSLAGNNLEKMAEVQTFLYVWSLPSALKVARMLTSDRVGNWPTCAPHPAADDGHIRAPVRVAGRANGICGERDDEPDGTVDARGRRQPAHAASCGAQQDACHIIERLLSRCGNAHHSLRFHPLVLHLPCSAHNSVT